LVFDIKFVARLNQLVETKLQKEVSSFLVDIKKLAPHRVSEAEGHWKNYKPELEKCEGKDEIARLLLGFFERELKAVKDEVKAKEFHKLRYDTVGRLRNCLFALRVHKNSIKDYTKYLHAIKGKELERGIRMADEKPWETPEEISGKPIVRQPITTKEFRKRHGSPKGKKSISYYMNKYELIAAGGFAVSFVAWILYKIFT